MKQLVEYLSTKAKLSIHATDKTIHQIVKDELDRLGHDADLNHIDTSEVTDMKNLFSCDQFDLGQKYKDLNPDISQWNVSKVTNMGWMFCSSFKFNCDISKWDMSSVKNMRCMFYDCKNFNQDLSKWCVSNVEDMNYMFGKCTIFNNHLYNWDVSNVKNFQGMFWKASAFNMPIFKWNTESAKNMDSMFSGALKFSQDLSKWNVENIEFAAFMFADCPMREKQNIWPKFNEDVIRQIKLSIGL